MTDPKNDEIWLDIDALSNAIDYLSMAARALEDLSDPFRWKWATIGVADGLYGLMICALEGTNYANVIDHGPIPKGDRQKLSELWGKGDAESIRQAMAIQDEFLNSRAAKLFSFETALKVLRRTAENHGDEFLGKRTIDLTENGFQNILVLWREYRNRFEHFVPMLLAIHQPRVLDLLDDAVVAARQLSESFDIWMTYGERRDEIGLVVERVQKALAMNRDYFAALAAKKQ